MYYSRLLLEGDLILGILKTEEGIFLIQDLLSIRLYLNAFSFFCLFSFITFVCPPYILLTTIPSYYIYVHTNIYIHSFRLLETS